MFKFNENVILLLADGIAGFDLSSIGPVSGVQIYSEIPLAETDLAVINSSLANVRICQSASEIEVLSFTRVIKYMATKSIEDLYYKLTGREDYPFIVTVAEAHRPVIREQNQLDRFHPNLELALKELVK